MTRFVIFDLFNTLLGGADLDRERVVAEMAAVVGVEPAALIEAYNATWRQRQTEWDIEQTVRTLAGRLGASPSPEQVTRAAELRRAFARRVLASVQDSTIEVLAALRASDCKLGLVSNATSDTSEAWPGSRLAEYLDVAIFSCEVRLAKPDPGIYLAATTALGTDPAHCTYLGDGADRELPGAAALGMTVYRTTEHADNDPSWPGPAISALRDLLPLLPAPDTYS